MQERLGGKKKKNLSYFWYPLWKLGVGSFLLQPNPYIPLSTCISTETCLILHDTCGIIFLSAYLLHFLIQPVKFS